MRLTYPKWALLAAALTVLALALCLGAWRLSFRPLAELPGPATSQAQPAVDGLVDINTAGLEELMTLPGIGPVRAQAILDYRESSGPFRYPEDLIYVSGIGEGTVAGLLDYITTGGDVNAENIGG